jgi:hypothetical protein
LFGGAPQRKDGAAARMKEAAPLGRGAAFLGQRAWRSDARLIGMNAEGGD